MAETPVTVNAGRMGALEALAHLIGREREAAELALKNVVEMSRARLSRGYEYGIYDNGADLHDQMLRLVRAHAALEALQRASAGILHLIGEDVRRGITDAEAPRG